MQARSVTCVGLLLHAVLDLLPEDEFDACMRKNPSEFDEIYPNEVTFFPRRLSLDGSVVARLLDLSVTAISNMSNCWEYPHAG
jgi:hypothetical protein